MTQTINPQLIAAEVRAEMARQRVVQRQLAEALDLSAMQVSDRLSGKVEFKASELAGTAEFLGVPLQQLVPAKAAA